ncbi:MAG TPA: ferritin family protein [Candidatus Cloacimonadota bacterium]|nr:ferritin family protein [Candidatus Cloacimonadota bacterium]
MRSIKKAMQGEMDSVTIYKSAAGYSSDPEVKEFFLSRMKEEETHYNYLLEYYKMISEDKDISNISTDLVLENLVDTIFSSTFIKRVGEDQVLFSAISAALLLEKDAIDFYSKCEAEAEDITLKSFYGMMVKWETRHHDALVEIQKEAEEYYWQINDFQPF